MYDDDGRETISAIFPEIEKKKSDADANVENYFNWISESLTASETNFKLQSFNFDEKKVVVVVSIYDHLQSVISNFKRTSFLMWIDNEGLNIVFGDIQDDVSKDKGLNFYDWTQIDSISLEFKPDENQIITDNDLFTYKKVKGYYHRKWLIFPLKDLDKYKLKERVDINKKSD
jgi:hypothetical protein